MKGITVLPRTRTDNLVVRELDDETLVYDTERDEAHCLNQTAALVWKHCDGKTTAREAVQSLQGTLGVSVDADIVWLAVQQLQRFHLVEDTPKKSPGVSRRALVLKYAPAALALPVIMSITAPTPAQSASPCAFSEGRPNGCPCSSDSQCANSCNSGTCGPAL
jgi:Coenzyme PQQ synthesis protein D (PqqD)